MLAIPSVAPQTFASVATRPKLLKRLYDFQADHIAEYTRAHERCVASSWCPFKISTLTPLGKGSTEYTHAQRIKSDQQIMHLVDDGDNCIVERIAVDRSFAK